MAYMIPQSASDPFMQGVVGGRGNPIASCWNEILYDCFP